MLVFKPAGLLALGFHAIRRTTSPCRLLAAYQGSDLLDFVSTGSLNQQWFTAFRSEACSFVGHDTTQVQGFSVGFYNRLLL